MVALPRSLLLAVFLLAAPAANAADFTDSDYHQEVFMEWHTAHLDVLIPPPAMGDSASRQRALLDSVEAWAAAVADHGVSWLAEGVEIVAYAPGLHDAPPAGFEPDDLEIVIALTVQNGISGVPLSIGGLAAAVVPCEHVPHEHPGSPWGVASVSCPDVDRCLIFNTSEPTDGSLFRLGGHEFGHCLGLGHVGDASFTASAVPADDVMSYTWDVSGCPSTLNLLAMQGAFAAVLGEAQPPVDLIDGLRYVRQAPDDYQVFPCDGPTG